MTLASLSHSVRRAVRAVAALIALPLLLTSCRDEEAEARERLVGTYERVLDGGPKGMWHVRQVLTVKPDGRWLRTAHIRSANRTEDSPPDSGTFRIQGVTLVLRSLVEPGGVPFRYTIAGDTLFNTNATAVHAITGHDIGDEIYTRVR